MTAASPKATRKTSVGRSNSGGFFNCFKPVVTEPEDGLVRSRSSWKAGLDQEAVAYISFGGRKEVDIFPGITPRESKGEGGIVADLPPKGRARKSSSHLKKAGFFEMSLVRKFRKKNNSKKSEELDGDLSRKAERILRLMNESAAKNDSREEVGRTDSDISTSSHSSATVAVSLSLTAFNRSSSFDASTNSLEHGASKPARSASFEQKWTRQDRPPARRCAFFADSPACLILLTLAALIFCGKVYAIVCTSTWMLLFVSSSRLLRRASSDIGDANDKPTDSPKYKKRIIWEGLLQRQRSRCPQQL